jgi:hypothetical protein
MVGHDHECSKSVVAQFLTTKKRLHDDLRDRRVFEEQWTEPCRVQVTIHPNKGLAGRLLPRWRVEVVRETAMQVPRYKQPLPGGIFVGQSAAMAAHVK